MFKRVSTKYNFHGFFGVVPIKYSLLPVRIGLKSCYFYILHTSYVQVVSIQHGKKFDFTLLVKVLYSNRIAYSKHSDILSITVPTVYPPFSPFNSLLSINSSLMTNIFPTTSGVTRVITLQYPVIICFSYRYQVRPSRQENHSSNSTSVCSTTVEK